MRQLGGELLFGGRRIDEQLMVGVTVLAVRAAVVAVVAMVVAAIVVVMVVVVAVAVAVVVTIAGSHHSGRGGRSGGGMADFVVVIEGFGQQAGYAEGQVFAGR